MTCETQMISGETYTVHIGNNLDILPTLEDNSVDSIVTDPPYELGFMGKKWDSTGIAYSPDLWRECLRVLKPGGHLLSFGGSRTWHRIAVAIEDAGFEVRDSIAWLYGSGFPKSLDISKAIDKQAGFEGEVIGTETIDIGMQGGSMHAGRERKLADREIKKLSPEAQQWEGWGTALKPAFEPVIVARKPLIGTVAENVLTYGTGGLNIDGSRVKGESWSRPPQSGVPHEGNWKSIPTESNSLGRWPANVILDEHTAELLDEQSGISKSSPRTVADRRTNSTHDYGFKSDVYSPHNDAGGASRFFYVAKASKRDRNEGLEDQNIHPTVKPTDLMRYLIKLVTPPNGIVLDPFTGSGSTGKAAILEGFRFIGIEMTEDYIPIIDGRLKHAEAERNKGLF